MCIAAEAWNFPLFVSHQALQSVDTMLPASHQFDTPDVNVLGSIAI